jgi:hypothetical protein
MDTKETEPNYYEKVQDGEYKTTPAMQELLRILKLKGLAELASYKSPSVFHQRVNQYDLNGKPATFTYITLLAFYEALSKYVIKLNKLLAQTQDILEKIKPFENKQLHPTPKEVKLNNNSDITVRVLVDAE